MPLRRENALAYAHLTEAELRRLHMRFGYPRPLVSHLHRLFAQAGHEVDAQALAAIERICRNYQLHTSRPGRFYVHPPRRP